MIGKIGTQFIGRRPPDPLPDPCGGEGESLLSHRQTMKSTARPTSVEASSPATAPSMICAINCGLTNCRAIPPATSERENGDARPGGGGDSRVAASSSGVQGSSEILVGSPKTVPPIGLRSGGIVDSVDRSLMRS